MKSKIILIVLLSVLFIPSNFVKAQKKTSLNKKTPYADNIVVFNNEGSHHDTILIRYFLENAPERFNAPKTPSFAFMSKDNMFMLGIGGYVKGTISMDFNGAINNPAYFTTSNIAVNPMYKNNSLLQYNVNESTIFYNLVSLSDKKNKFGAYINMNFSGNNYTPVIEDAYITYGGLLMGRTTSIFTDAAAIPPTIDGEGPNALTYKTNLVLNYRGKLGKHFSTGIGLEMPTTDFTTSNNQKLTNQFIPDIPSYIQFNWGENKSNHLRLSSIIRNVSYRDVTKNENNIISTYACQLSGLTTIKEKLTFYYQFAYGTGISTYIQDVNGLKLDFLPSYTEDQDDNEKLDYVNAMAYYIGLQYNFSNKTFISCTFSQVDLKMPKHYEDTYLYKQAYYLATNFFWYAAPNVQLGAEYLYGKRVDQNSEWGQANRIQMMLQYNF